MITLTPTGIDDTAQLQAALATHRIVRLGEGDFLATGDLVISQQRAKFISDDGATLTFTTPDRPGITLAGWLNEIEIAGINLGRNVPAAPGAHGIDCGGVSCNYAYLHDMKVRDQHIGMNLGCTGWSHVERIVIERSVTDGLRMSNGMPNGTLQWQLDDVYSAQNGNRGFLVVTLPGGAAQVTLGEWSKITTWANTGCGAAFVGRPDVPLHGVRIAGKRSFLGGDGNHELFFDTYGDLHAISEIFVELAGKRTTGPTLSTPASGVGFGIFMSANNAGLHGVNIRASNNSSGSFKLSNAQQRIRESVDSAGQLLNCAGPGTF
jgi:hypothetical protein